MKVNVNGKRYELVIRHDSRGGEWVIYMKMPIGVRTMVFCPCGATKAEAINNALKSLAKYPERYLDCVVS